MIKRVVLSLDYDGCADILFNDMLRKHVYFDAKKNQYQIANLVAFDACRRTLLDLITKLTETKLTSVFIGSNRQSIFIDNEIELANENGFAIKNIPDLCKKHNFTFIPFLLADKYKPFYSHFLKQSDAPLKNAVVDSRVGYPSPAMKVGVKEREWDPKKTELIAEQLKKAHELYPLDEIDFYFIDDDHKNTLIKGIAHHFQEHREQFPPNIRLHLIKFDWFLTVSSACGENKTRECIQKEAVDSINIVSVHKGANRMYELQGGKEDFIEKANLSEAVRAGKTPNFKTVKSRFQVTDAEEDTLVYSYPSSIFQGKHRSYTIEDCTDDEKEPTSPSQRI